MRPRTTDTRTRGRAASSAGSFCRQPGGSAALNAARRPTITVRAELSAGNTGMKKPPRWNPSPAIPGRSREPGRPHGGFPTGG
nr:MAG TPA: hypothetical protein [Caudoviricetes sp.]